MELAKVEPTEVARPLRVLVPLIKDDLKQGDDAAKSAGMPYYAAAGGKMIEAKPQVPGRFESWIKETFKITPDHARQYMSLYRATNGEQKVAASTFSSIKDFRRRHLGHDIPTSGGSMRKPSWQEPVKEAIGRVNVESLKQDALAKQEERTLQRKLALSLIDIGYKALASRLHPDKGGSREAMSRLNRVRELLKGAVT